MRPLRIISASAILSASLCAAVPGNALVEKTRMAAAACSIISDASFTDDGLIETRKSKYRSKLLCPMDDSLRVNTSELTWVHVHFIDHLQGDTGVATACVKYFFNEGGSCGDQSFAGPNRATGAQVIDVTPAWSEEAWKGFPYVYVELPGATMVVPSELQGLSAGSP